MGCGLWLPATEGLDVVVFGINCEPRAVQRNAPGGLPRAFLKQAARVLEAPRTYEKQRKYIRIHPPSRNP